MTYLFKPTINGKDSWAKHFQSTNAFEALAESIFVHNHLEFSGLENLTPGTNAVFRVGDKVIKIFAPESSGFYDEDYFSIETEAQKHANGLQINAPRLLFTGMVTDRYPFRYMVMDFIHGREAEQVTPSFTDEQRKGFALQLKEITKRLNIELKRSCKSKIA